MVKLTNRDCSRNIFSKNYKRFFMLLLFLTIGSFMFIYFSKEQNDTKMSKVVFNQDIVYKKNESVDIEHFIQNIDLQMSEFDRVISVTKVDTKETTTYMPLYQEQQGGSDLSLTVTNNSKYGSNIENGVLRISIDGITKEYDLSKNIHYSISNAGIVVDEVSALPIDNFVETRTALVRKKDKLIGELKVEINNKQETHQFLYDVHDIFLAP